MSWDNRKFVSFFPFLITGEKKNTKPTISPLRCGYGNSIHYHALATVLVLLPAIKCVDLALYSFLGMNSVLFIEYIVILRD